LAAKSEAAVLLTFHREFNAVHRLWNPALDERRNEELFAECANPSGHGHFYRVEMTVKAAVGGRRPVVMEREDIRRITDEVIGARLEDADMNTVFERKDFISTGENIVPEIWRMVESELPGDVKLVSIRLTSTPRNCFTFYGPGRPVITD
jgi:6-pyruvoyltetrahydropterin/6-carboxytetrahydropterin synthase